MNAIRGVRSDIKAYRGSGRFLQGDEDVCQNKERDECVIWIEVMVRAGVSCLSFI